jgi:succinyl-CoA--D-citramalate CoA-transferase
MTETAEAASAALRAGPLRGLRVIDAGNMIAGPLAATQLADFGAEVIKVELPGVGDSMRHWTPMKDGRSLWWKVIGRNKKLVTLTLSTP